MQVPPGSEVTRLVRVLKPLHGILILLNKEIQADLGLAQIILENSTSQLTGKRDTHWTDSLMHHSNLKGKH